MKVYLACHTCLKTHHEQRNTNEPVTVQLQYASHHVTDDDVYETTCEQGHRTISVLQNPRFEVLFDSGVLALEDAYLRESVASCAGALEEFYAFYVRVILRARGLEQPVVERFGKFTRLSERRLGAMHMAYVLENGATFTLDEDKQRKFRNDVIHDGHWPSADKARAYATYVYETISDLGHPLRAKHADAFLAESIAHVHSAHEAVKKRLASEAEELLWTTATATVLNFTLAGKKRPFTDAVKAWKASGNMWQGNRAELMIG